MQQECGKQGKIMISGREKENEARYLFLNNVSHEARAPINVILGYIEMILRESKEGNTVAYASDIQAAARTLLAIVNDTADFSSIQEIWMIRRSLTCSGPEIRRLSGRRTKPMDGSSMCCRTGSSATGRMPGNASMIPTSKPGRSFLPSGLPIFMPSWHPSAGICPSTGWTGAWRQNGTRRWWH